MTPLAEEVPELRQLMMLDLEDDDGRRKLYEDPAFEAAFKKMWRHGKTGWSLARLRRILRTEELALRRDIEEMFVETAPVKAWTGERFADIFARLKKYQSTLTGAKDDEERAAFDAFPVCVDEADFVFHLLKSYDRDLYWHTVSANADDRMVRKLTMSPLFLPGFSDSGAHLTNLAFYDVNLRALKLAFEERGEEGVAYMVRRLTRDPANFFGIEAGSIDPGAQADFALIDPDALMKHDGVAATKRLYRETLGHDQLVNRADGVVTMTMIAGEAAWRDEQFTDAFENRKLGGVLLADGESALPRSAKMAAE